MIQATIGQAVLFVDTHRVKRAAIVTHVFRSDSFPGHPDGVNVVYVSDDAAREDNYGRQIERATSVPHMSTQPARGYGWQHVDE